MKKINFGCENNKLVGWLNYDIDIDIRETLPFDNNTIDYIFAEHIIEHISNYEVVSFLTECYRILKPGGAIRIIVPCIDRVYKAKTDMEKLMETKTRKESIIKTISGWGHKSWFTKDILEAIFYTSGFHNIKEKEHNKSGYKEMENIDYHVNFKVSQNAILEFPAKEESVIMEAVK